MSRTSNTITMLTEYNITTTGDARQSSSAGTIAFSSTHYWVHDVYGTDEYVSGYPNSINCDGCVYDENSYLYPIVEAYEAYLKNTLNVSSASATLMSRAQNNALSSTSWANSTEEYWLGYAVDWIDTWFVYTNSGSALSNERCGVRPVVTISTSDVD